MQGKVYAILLYLPESTAVKNGKMLGRAKIKKINFKFIFEIKKLVSNLFIFEKKIEMIRPKKPTRKIKTYRITCGNFHATSAL